VCKVAKFTKVVYGERKKADVVVVDGSLQKLDSDQLHTFSLS
jgi:hypothetical protein